MAKSKIIKEIANGTVTLETTLKRALVIAHDLKNEKMIEWIKNELYGYTDVSALPEYRKLLGTLKISYVSGLTQVNNQSVGAGILPDDYKDANIYNCRDSVKTIEELIKSGHGGTVSLSELIPFLKKGSSGINVFSFMLEIPNGAFSRVIDMVSREIMEILLKIDDELGNIDELDVELPNGGANELNSSINVYIDSFINLGENNDISKTNISGGNIKNEK